MEESVELELEGVPKVAIYERQYWDQSGDSGRRSVAAAREYKHAAMTSVNTPTWLAARYCSVLTYRTRMAPSNDIRK